MRRSHILIGAGCLFVFTIGTGFAIAQQSISPAAAAPEDIAPIRAAPEGSRLLDGRPERNRPLGNRPTDGGPVLTFGIKSTLTATDNYSLRPNSGDSAALFDTGLSFGYLNRRANDVLSFDLDGTLRAIEPPGKGSRIFDNQRARLNYNREGVKSALSLGLDYDYTSVNSLDPFENNRFFEDEPLDETDLTQDQGNRQQIGARFTFETGLNNPVGFILSGRYRDRIYSDTTDPDLFNTETFNLSGTTRLTLSPVIETRLILSYEDYTADDTSRTNRRTSGINVGLTRALSSTDSLDISIGYLDIETDETILGTRRTDTESGVVGSLGLTRELARGSIGTTLELRESVNGQSATWLVNHALLLPRGSVEVSLGVTSDVDDTIRPVGSVDFIHQMLRSTFTASLSRQVSTSTQSNELRTTQASLGYNYEINSLSDLNFAADYSATQRIGGMAAKDTTRTNLRATYSHGLTRDWRLSTGYEYRMRDETGSDTATSNRVFLKLQREFIIRP